MDASLSTALSQLYRSTAGKIVEKVLLAQRIRKQAGIMILIVMGMFAFCYALVPLYNVFCAVTGLNGKTPGEAQPIATNVDYSRTVTVELLATLNETLPGEFFSQHKKFTLHPGEYVRTAYWVKNLTPAPMTVQAIPSVTPGIAGQHVKKIECFCFKHQPLAAQEGKNMPLVFTVDPALPKEVHTLTLAYTLFDVTHR